MRPKCTSFVLGIMCIALAVVAACMDSSPPPNEGTFPVLAPGAEKQPWAPDVAIVLVPDIEGNFRDCNCSGASIGGLDRIPFAANDAPELQFVFHGSTLFPPSGRSAASNLTDHNVKAVLQATAVLWRKIRTVSWLPCQQDLDVVKKHGFLELFAPFILTDNRVTTQGLIIEPDEATASVILTVGNSSIPITGAQRHASGREITVVGMWVEDRSDALKASYSRTLGLLASHRPETGSPSLQLLEKERAKAAKIVSAWRAYLPATTPRADWIASLLDDYDMEVSHNAHAVGDADSTLVLAGLKQSVVACATCHPNAVDAWLESRHSHAWATLQAKRQHTNPKCLACHVETPQLFTSHAMGDITSTHALAAVTCRTCHSSTAKTTLTTCEQCHTSHTDPTGHYRVRYKDICPGDIRPDKERFKCEIR